MTYCAKTTKIGLWDAESSAAAGGRAGRCHGDMGGLVEKSSSA